MEKTMEEIRAEIVAEHEIPTPSLEYRLMRLRGDAEMLELLADTMRDGDPCDAWFEALRSLAATIQEHLGAISAAMFASEGVGVADLPCPTRYRPGRSPEAEDVAESDGEADHD